MIQITKQQRRMLERYLRYRGTNPTVLALMRESWRMYTVLFFACVALATMYWMLGGFPWATAIILMFITAVGRDIAYFRASVKAWPVVREITDWSEVEKRLRS